MAYVEPIPINAKDMVLKVDVAATYPATTVVLDATITRFEKISENSEYKSSSTAGRIRRFAGAKDYKLTFTILAQAGVVVWSHLEGAVISVYVITTGTTGYKGYFIIDRITAEVDVKTKEPISITVECSGEGSPGIEAVA